MPKTLYFLMLLLAAVPCDAQLDRGALTGTVTDSSGAVVPGAHISIVNTGTKATYQTGTTGIGQYHMPTLPAGVYSVTFEAPSFKKLVRNNIQIRATDVVRVDAVLEIGAVSETVSVNEAPAMIQTETPQVASAFSGQNLLNSALPIPYGGRLPDNLPGKIMPGISGDSWDMRINGSTNFAKETLIDGASTATYLSGFAGENSPSMEALEELKVQVGGTSAEFGRTQGAVFNYTMKSGTNRIHGSGYGGMKNEAFNSNGFANNARGVARPYQRMFNYAGSLGGPVNLPKVYDGRNRTFFYTAYEHYRERDRRTGAATLTYPVPEFYQGDFSRLLGPSTGLKDALNRDVLQGAIYDPATFRQLENGRWIGDMFPGNRMPASRISRVSRNLNAISEKYYLPQVKDGSGRYLLQNNAYSRANPQPSFDQDNFSIKVDHNVNNQHKFSSVYSYTARPRVTLQSSPIWNQAEENGGPLSRAQKQDLVNQLGRVSETWIISPRLLNHVTLSYNRAYNPTRNLWASVDGAAELGIANLHTTGYPEVSWGGGPFVTLNNPGFTNTSLQVYEGWGAMDTVSFSKGRHFMKAGIDIRGNRENSIPGQSVSFNFSPLATSIPGETFAGTRTGYAFASYLLGTVNSGSRNDPVGIGDRVRYYAFFYQDDFKVTPRLTVQLGVRWELQPPQFEVGNRLSSWSTAAIDPVSGLKGAYEFAGDCQKCTGRNYFGKRSYHDFGPRIGLAYRVTNKMSFRAAYGIIYEANLFNYFGGTGTPLNKATSTAWGGTYNLAADAVRPWAGIFNWDNGFPTNRYVPAAMDPSWGNVSRPGMIAPNFGTSPYIQQWNANLQRELPGRVVVDLGYLANKGTSLRNGLLEAINQIPASALTTYGRNLTNAVTSAAQAAANGIAYPYPGFRGTVASGIRAYPQVSGNSTVQVYGSPRGFSFYNSLQLSVSRQMSKGLSVYGNFVWSKALTNTTSSMAGNNSAPFDYYNLQLEKTFTNGDVPRALKVTFFYDLPFGRGKALLGTAPRVVNHLIGGWSLSGIVNYIDGTPLNFTSSSPLANGWNGGSNRVNVLPGDLKRADFDKSAFNIANTAAASNTYLNKSMFSQPAPLTLGTAARRFGQLRGFGITNEDFVIRKSLIDRERYRWVIRADIQNAFNRSTLGAINTNVNNALFGQVTSIGGYRQVQLVTRFEF
ncbi:MAG: TonB-dependent receptor [Acidobacteria bacterium]|nr:TonB-dependent receptor [Acidobacteriota bacterium]